MSEDTPGEAIVSTSAGKVKGTFRKGCYIFCGIPYAAPPTGPRRWLPPTPPPPWDGVRPAHRFAAIAPQNRMENEVIAPREPEVQDEDCLYLNVWTPGLDDARRPVLFWIHGGGFTTGSGSMPAYNGRPLATRGDVVVVTINYRLGLLGFLNLAEVTGGKIPATGNEGLLDQVLALQWVQENIAAFGGDPDNITIFGESAGGMSVASLMALPAARGLFHKAIPQSGAAHTVNSLERAVKVARLALDILGVKATDVDVLRSMNVRQLLDAQRELAVRAAERDSGIGVGMALQPVVDGNVLPRVPIESIRQGSADGIPVLVGTTLDEWKLLAIGDPGLKDMTEERLTRRLQRLVPAEAVPNLIEGYRRARQARGLPTTPAEIFHAIQTDRTFRIPAIRLAESHCQREQPAYMYLFTWPSPILNGRLGACHALELGFVFGVLEPNFHGSGPEAEALRDRMMDAWLAFARSSDPSTPGLGKWPRYCQDRATMLLGRECQVVEDPMPEERRLWAGLPEIVQGSI